jgi:ABC-2 type transport system ATP-binding protein
MSAIKVSGLSKHFRIFSRREGITGAVKDLFHREYSTLKAVNQISFSLERGELVGFIGPNGAGKSTTIKMLTGILKPSEGDMEVIGYHPFRDRKKYTKNIGVVFGQRTQLWWDIAVIESLKLLGSIYEVPDRQFRKTFDNLVDILELQEFLYTPVRKISLGQRIRADLAASLIHSPDVLYLDEPTIGLDTVVKNKVQSFLKQINDEFKTTIILTTHDLQEIEELCKRVIIIDRGSLVFDGALYAVKSLPDLGKQITVDFLQDISAGELSQIIGQDVTIHQESPRRLNINYNPRNRQTVEVINCILNHMDIADLTVTEPGIEEVIMKIYREGL